jgi:hypothetical protein
MLDTAPVDHVAERARMALTDAERTAPRVPPIRA